MAEPQLQRLTLALRLLADRLLQPSLCVRLQRQVIVVLVSATGIGTRRIIIGCSIVPIVTLLVTVRNRKGMAAITAKYRLLIVDHLLLAQLLQLAQLQLPLLRPIRVLL